MRHNLNQARKAGFSLVELLVVITIVALMATASGPAFNALISSGGANENLNQLSGILEQARQYAVSENTYVWVAFYTPANTSPKQVSVAVIASTDGTDPAVNTGNTWSGYSYDQSDGNLSANSTLKLVNKIVTLKGVSLQFSSTPPASLQSSASPLATNSNGFFLIQVPGSSSVSSFTQAVQFTPSGQAQISSSPVALIDVDVQPQKGNVDDSKNLAVLRINGLTGETVLYRE